MTDTEGRPGLSVLLFEPQSICNAAEVWKVKSNKNTGNSLLKVPGGAWGTPVMATPVLKNTLQFKNCSKLEVDGYETCF